MNDLARRLRKASTDVEQRLWQRLKNRQLGGFKFRRQHPIPPYIVDFVCLEAGLIVEFDGGQHARRSDADANRTLRLEAGGYRVIRFWNNEALEKLEEVVEEILRQLGAPHPNPLPASGERE